MLQAIVFDFDGVIADTEPLHYRAFAKVLRTEGIDLSQEEYFETYLGLNDATFLRQLFADRERPLADTDRIRLQSAKDATYRAHIADGLPLLSGVRELIDRSEGNRAMAICSGARRTEIDAILARHRLSAQLPIVVSADEVPRSKPDPAGYRRTLDLLAATKPSIRPEDCLAIEDSLLGIRAARAAGMRVLSLFVHSKHPTQNNRLECEREANWSCDGLEQITEDILSQWFAG